MKLNKSKDKRTMTIYENIRNSKAAACIITALLMTASCTQDDMATDGGAGLLAPDETSGIFISDTGTGTSATRAFVEPNDEKTGPQVEGICRADKMDVYVFKLEDSYTINFPKEEELSYKNTLPPKVKVFGNDRYAECTAKIEHESGDVLVNYTYVLSSALAYSEADKSLFNVNLKGFNRTNVPLTLQKDNGKYKTPELFYGIVKGKGNDIKFNENKFPNGFYWEGTGDKGDKTVTFYGRIFRIVSQLNLHITEIPSEAIKRIELYGDNYPTEIKLYGTHGAFYPVTAASKTTGEAQTGDNNTDLAQSDKYVLLDSKDIAGGTEEITLSTFLLPSEKGMHLKMRVYFYNDPDQGNDGGTNPEYKDYDIRPGKSYMLDDDDATYTVANDLHYDNDASSRDLYIYDSRKGKLCFYSYSNVRVNMSGKLEDIVGETSTSDIEIEVEPGFEKVHKIPLSKN